MTDDTRERKHDTWPFFALIILLGAVVVSWLLFPNFLRWRFPEGDVQTFADWGNGYGGLGALFSAVAFALLGFTAILQWIELRHQREDSRKQARMLQDQLTFLRRERELADKDFERKRKPIFFVRPGSFKRAGTIIFSLYNYGANIYDPKFRKHSLEGIQGLKTNPDLPTSFETGNSIDLIWVIEEAVVETRKSLEGLTLSLDVDYLDIFSEWQRETIKMKIEIGQLGIPTAK